MKEKLQKIITKGNYTKTKIVVGIILSIIAAILIAEAQIVTQYFNWDSVVILTGVIFFILLHFILKLDTMYEWIYKKRFIIAVLVLFYVTIMGYSGSSIGMQNNYIQPESTQENFYPILGIARGIRSDEWAVTTPIWHSQVSNEKNNFSYFNDYLRGTMTDMFSIINTPVKSILTIAKPFNIMFLLAGFKHGLAFMWYGKVIALMLVSFEFCMLLSDKKKLISLFGMILITFSAGVQWWNSTEIIMWGMLALLCINQFMIASKLKIKLLCALGIFFSGISYIFVFYPAWQIPYGLVWLACIIWLWIKNKYKLNLKDIAIILVTIIAIGAMVGIYFYVSQDALTITMNTSYPGQRFEIGGGGLRQLFSYVYTFLLPYNDVGNPCEMSGMSSYFPIPFLISIIYLIRNKERKAHLEFYIPMFIVTIILTTFALIPTSRLFARLTLLYMSMGKRVAVTVGLIQIMLLIYTMGRIKENDKMLGENTAKIISLVASIVIFSIAINTITGFSLGALESYVCGLVLVLAIYYMFTINKEKSKKYLMAVLIPISLIGGSTVNPIHKGIDILTEKPIAQAVQKIVKEDKENNLWLTDESPFYLSNYILANGAKVINSTNPYPNKKLFETILGKEKIEQEEIKTIYNRYSHMTMTITKEESYIKLASPDVVNVYINVNVLKNLNVKYILSMRELEEYNSQEITFELLYSEEGLYIYRVNYN